VFERSGFPRLAFVEHCYAGDDTNWWIPNRACTAAMLRSSGFIVDSNPEEEVFVCRPGPAGYGNAVYPACPRRPGNGAAA
jgi:tRNA (mo5U34)-methyltransferase